MVPETQPTPPPQRRKGKKQVREGVAQPGRQKPTAWLPHEELVLVKAWADISKDSIQGNAQPGDHFWFRILEQFQEELEKGDDYRTKHQLNSKFREIAKGVSKINGLYNNLKTQWKSGQGDEQILQEVLQFYLEEVEKYDQDFIFGVQQSKRTKTGSSGYTTSSDARVGLDLNQDDELELEEIVRPMGRDKAKRKGKGTSSGASDFSGDIDEMRKITSSFDRYNLNFSERLAFDKEKEETRKKERTERQKMEDMKFLMENVDHLSGLALEFVMKKREKKFEKIFSVGRCWFV
ncbi:glutathione S-transferase T3-like [Lactuca sativa]|uniref:glutathione S-transferase T3-like n=1 Tax=Lactuca sativa TaxID=4236 RepID=UPI000CD826A1|nr:glutathione S-transferase T3-like [Lactuca sativa]